jgi:hypothetical protein
VVFGRAGVWQETETTDMDKILWNRMCRERRSECVYVCFLCLDAIQVDKRKVQAVANVSESLLFGDQLICAITKLVWSAEMLNKT